MFTSALLLPYVYSSWRLLTAQSAIMDHHIQVIKDTYDHVIIVSSTTANVSDTETTRAIFATKVFHNRGTRSEW